MFFTITALTYTLSWPDLPAGGGWSHLERALTSVAAFPVTSRAQPGPASQPCVLHSVCPAKHQDHAAAVRRLRKRTRERARKRWWARTQTLVGAHANAGGRARKRRAISLRAVSRPLLCSDAAGRLNEVEGEAPRAVRKRHARPPGAGGGWQQQHLGHSADRGPEALPPAGPRPQAGTGRACVSVGMCAGACGSKQGGCWGGGVQGGAPVERVPVCFRQGWFLGNGCCCCFCLLASSAR
jgi:hypothetical protein